MAFKERVFSGMQPTGSLHLGNYLGAMVQWVEMQKTHECIYCVVDMHAITVWQDPDELKTAIRQVTAAYIASGLDPKTQHPLQSEPGAGARRARLGLQLRGAARLAQPHDAVQGEGRQGPRERLGRPLRLSEPDGGRHPRLPRHARAGRRRPEAASGAGPRHRAEVQQRLQPSIETAGYRGRHLLPAAGAGDHRAGDARHEPARRHQEDVEVGRLGPVAHQPDRRRRHDRQEDPEGQDRSRAAAVGAKPGSKARPEADNLVGIYAALAGTDEGCRCSPSSAARSSRPSRRRWPSWRSPSSGPIARRDEAPAGRSRPRSTACWPTAPSAARAIAGPIMDEVKDIVGFLRS